MDELGNPNDEEMSEKCICGHTLGQHSYGAELFWNVVCDYPSECGCRYFEPVV